MQPIPIVLLGGGGAEPDLCVVVSGLRQACQGGFGQQIATLRQEISQRYFAIGPRQAARGQCVQPFEHAGFTATWGADAVTVKPGHFHDANVARHISHFLAYDAEGIVETKTQRFFEIRGRLEESGPLPTIDHSEFGAGVFQHRIKRRGTGRAPRQPVLVRQVEAEFVLIVFDSFDFGVLRCRVAAEAARVQAPGVPLRLAVDHDLRQYLAVPAAFTHPGAKTDDGIGVDQTGRLAHQWQTIGGIGDGTVDNRVNAGAG